MNDYKRLSEQSLFPPESRAGKHNTQPTSYAMEVCWMMQRERKPFNAQDKERILPAEARTS